MINRTRLNIIYIKTCVLKAEKQLKLSILWRKLKTRLTTSKTVSGRQPRKTIFVRLPDPCL